MDYAKCYSAPNNILHDMLRRLIAGTKSLLSSINLAVDAGCGPGQYLPDLRNILSEKGIVLALDHLEDMLNAVRSQVSSQCWTNVRTVKSKIEDMGSYVEAGTVDLVLCGSSLQFTDLSRSTEAIRRVLRNDGLLVFSVPMGLTGILEENPTGFYAVFQKQLTSNLIAEILKESSTYPMEEVMKKKPDRKFETFSSALSKSGIVISEHEILAQPVSADLLSDHLSVPWRAQKLLPNVEPEVAAKCIRNAVSKTISDLRVRGSIPFPRDFHYAVARKRVVNG
jgi:ubiquinone/menaquinone biosynthesis C-methylase UbiE